MKIGDELVSGQKMKGYRYYFFWMLIFPVVLYGQDQNSRLQDPQPLDSVFLKTNRLRDLSVGQRIQHIPIAEHRPNRSSLTSLLNFTTPIYFKENGLGMVSSPSFRGTTASQTAVLWNGIPVNSNFNGQLDFNTVDAGSYDEVDVRAGGGSLLYGSGAIGGSIHLQTKLRFKKELMNELYSSFGSYRTWENRYRVKYGTKKWSFRLSGMQNSSRNDYKYYKSGRRNKNGEFHNYTIDAALGYAINARNHIYGYGQIYRSNRNFPIFYNSENPSQYKDYNVRALVEWESRFAGFRSNFKTAFLKENYAYHPNLEKPGYSFGKTHTFIGKYNLQYKLVNQILFNVFVDYQHTAGKGTDILNVHRDITSFGLIFKHDLLPKLQYQLGGRKEITNTYQSPFLYSFGMSYTPFEFYEIKVSASKNFRRPTFNDLFWANSGNVNLKAEQANQIEWGNHFSLGNWKWSLTGYFNDINDMIHWLPASGGVFKPRNEDHVQTYGAEIFAGWETAFRQHVLNVKTNYSYTISRDKKSGRQLIYVPYHKATLSFTYEFKRILLDYQFLYNGSVYLRSDNNPAYRLSDYTVSNLTGSYAFGKKQELTVGGKIRNLFNAHYENVKRYEMPGVNFSIFVKLKL